MGSIKAWKYALCGEHILMDYALWDVKLGLKCYI